MAALYNQCFKTIFVHNSNYTDVSLALLISSLFFYPVLPDVFFRVFEDIFSIEFFLIGSIIVIVTSVSKS